jgi:hypothetical protein
VRKRQKCTCCETTQEEYLLPDFSMIEPTTPNGSKDKYKNQHIWSLSMDNSKLEKCLTPEISTIWIFFHHKTKDNKIYKNFTKFTVTVPLVLSKGTKEAMKFTKISQYSQ